MLDLTDKHAGGGGDAVRHRSDRADIDHVLFARRDAGDRAARDALVERFLPLARSIARRYERSGEPMDDLVQVASLALVKAIDGYDPLSGNAFSSYAVPTIAGELKRHFRDRTWMVRPPRELQELTLRVQSAVADFTMAHDRSPTVGELCQTLGASEEQILDALQARSARGALSLHATRGSDDDQQLLQDTIGVTEDGFELAESRAVIEALTGTLSPRLREIIRLRFHEDLTQAQIGELLGVSQMQISRLLRQALQTIRDTADQQPTIADAAPA